MNSLTKLLINDLEGKLYKKANIDLNLDSLTEEDKQIIEILENYAKRVSSKYNQSLQAYADSNYALSLTLVENSEFTSKIEYISNLMHKTLGPIYIKISISDGGINYDFYLTQGDNKLKILKNDFSEDTSLDIHKYIKEIKISDVQILSFEDNQTKFEDQKILKKIHYKHLFSELSRYQIEKNKLLKEFGRWTEKNRNSRDFKFNEELGKQYSVIKNHFIAIKQLKEALKLEHDDRESFDKSYLIPSQGSIPAFYQTSYKLYDDDLETIATNSAAIDEFKTLIKNEIKTLEGKVDESNSESLLIDFKKSKLNASRDHYKSLYSKYITNNNLVLSLDYNTMYSLKRIHSYEEETGFLSANTTNVDMGSIVSSNSKYKSSIPEINNLLNSLRKLEDYNRYFTQTSDTAGVFDDVWIEKLIDNTPLKSTVDVAKHYILSDPILNNDSEVDRLDAINTIFESDIFDVRTQTDINRIVIDNSLLIDEDSEFKQEGRYFTGSEFDPSEMATIKKDIKMHFQDDIKRVIEFHETVGEKVAYMVNRQAEYHAATYQIGRNYASNYAESFWDGIGPDMTSGVSLEKIQESYSKVRDARMIGEWQKEKSSILDTINSIVDEDLTGLDAGEKEEWKKEFKILIDDDIKRVEDTIFSYLPDQAFLSKIDNNSLFTRVSRSPRGHLTGASPNPFVAPFMSENEADDNFLKSSSRGIRYHSKSQRNFLLKILKEASDDAPKKIRNDLSFMDWFQSQTKTFFAGIDFDAILKIKFDQLKKTNDNLYDDYSFEIPYSDTMKIAVIDGVYSLRFHKLSPFLLDLPNKGNFSIINPIINIFLKSHLGEKKYNDLIQMIKDTDEDINVTYSLEMKYKSMDSERISLAQRLFPETMSISYKYKYKQLILTGNTNHHYDSVDQTKTDMFKKLAEIYSNNNFESELIRYHNSEHNSESKKEYLERRRELHSEEVETRLKTMQAEADAVIANRFLLENLDSIDIKALKLLSIIDQARYTAVLALISRAAQEKQTKSKTFLAGRAKKVSDNIERIKDTSEDPSFRDHVKAPSYLEFYRDVTEPENFYFDDKLSQDNNYVSARKALSIEIDSNGVSEISSKDSKLIKFERSDILSNDSYWITPNIDGSVDANANFIQNDAVDLNKGNESLKSWEQKGRRNKVEISELFGKLDRKSAASKSTLPIILRHLLSYSDSDFYKMSGWHPKTNEGYKLERISGADYVVQIDGNDTGKRPTDIDLSGRYYKLEENTKINISSYIKERYNFLEGLDNSYKRFTDDSIKEMSRMFDDIDSALVFISSNESISHTENIDIDNIPTPVKVIDAKKARLITFTNFYLEESFRLLKQARENIFERVTVGMEFPTDDVKFLAYIDANIKAIEYRTSTYGEATFSLGRQINKIYSDNPSESIYFFDEIETAKAPSDEPSKIVKRFEQRRLAEKDIEPRLFYTEMYFPESLSFPEEKQASHMEQISLQNLIEKKQISSFIRKIKETKFLSLETKRKMIDIFYDKVLLEKIGYTFHVDEAKQITLKWDSNPYLFDEVKASFSKERFVQKYREYYNMISSQDYQPDPKIDQSLKKIIVLDELDLLIVDRYQILLEKAKSENEASPKKAEVSEFRSSRKSLSDEELRYYLTENAMVYKSFNSKIRTSSEYNSYLGRHRADHAWVKQRILDLQNKIVSSKVYSTYFIGSDPEILKKELEITDPEIKEFSNNCEEYEKLQYQIEKQSDEIFQNNTLKEEFKEFMGINTKDKIDIYEELMKRLDDPEFIRTKKYNELILTISENLLRSSYVSSGSISDQKIIQLRELIRKSYSQTDVFYDPLNEGRVSISLSSSEDGSQVFEEAKKALKEFADSENAVGLKYFNILEIKSIIERMDNLSLQAIKENIKKYLSLKDESYIQAKSRLLFSVNESYNLMDAIQADATISNNEKNIIRGLNLELKMDGLYSQKKTAESAINKVEGPTTPAERQTLLFLINKVINKALEDYLDSANAQQTSKFLVLYDPNTTGAKTLEQAKPFFDGMLLSTISENDTLAKKYIVLLPEDGYKASLVGQEFTKGSDQLKGAVSESDKYDEEMIRQKTYLITSINKIDREFGGSVGSRVVTLETNLNQPFVQQELQSIRDIVKENFNLSGEILQVKENTTFGFGRPKKLSIKFAKMNDAFQELVKYQSDCIDRGQIDHAKDIYNQSKKVLRDYGANENDAGMLLKFFGFVDIQSIETIYKGKKVGDAQFARHVNRIRDIYLLIQRRANTIYLNSAYEYSGGLNKENLSEQIFSSNQKPKSDSFLDARLSDQAKELKKGKIYYSPIEFLSGDETNELFFKDFIIQDGSISLKIFNFNLNEEIDIKSLKQFFEVLDANTSYFKSIGLTNIANQLIELRYSFYAVYETGFWDRFNTSRKVLYKSLGLDYTGEVGKILYYIFSQTDLTRAEKIRLLDSMTDEEFMKLLEEHPALKDPTKRAEFFGMLKSVTSKLPNNILRILYFGSNIAVTGVLEGMLFLSGFRVLFSILRINFGLFHEIFLERNFIKLKGSFSKFFTRMVYPAVDRIGNRSSDEVKAIEDMTRISRNFGARSTFQETQYKAKQEILGKSNTTSAEEIRFKSRVNLRTSEIKSIWRKLGLRISSTTSPKTVSNAVSRFFKGFGRVFVYIGALFSVEGLRRNAYTRTPFNGVDFSQACIPVIAKAFYSMQKFKFSDEIHRGLNIGNGNETIFGNDQTIAGCEQINNQSLYRFIQKSLADQNFDINTKLDCLNKYIDNLLKVLKEASDARVDGSTVGAFDYNTALDWSAVKESIISGFYTFPMIQDPGGGWLDGSLEFVTNLVALVGNFCIAIVNLFIGGAFAIGSLASPELYYGKLKSPNSERSLQYSKKSYHLFREDIEQFRLSYSYMIRSLITPRIRPEFKKLLASGDSNTETATKTTCIDRLTPNLLYQSFIIDAKEFNRLKNLDESQLKKEMNIYKIKIKSKKQLLSDLNSYLGCK